ncbi:MAG: HNH endonuclease [Ruminococcus sp.]|nr:HNH endonuclease [Ruminococcus sp.]
MDITEKNIFLFRMRLPDRFYGRHANEGYRDSSSCGIEVDNFRPNYAPDGSCRYYGYVQNTEDSLRCISDDALVVWVSEGEAGVCASGIVLGWYRHARLFEKAKTDIPEEFARHRYYYGFPELKYNVYSGDAVIVPSFPENKRCHHILKNTFHHVCYRPDEAAKADIIRYIRENEDSFRAENSSLEQQLEEQKQLAAAEFGTDILGWETEVIARARVNQDYFRQRLLEKYGCRCSMKGCGVSRAELLNASHIKPWRVSGPEQKADVNNGLLLCPDHDRLFDRGFISFDQHGRLMTSPELTPEELSAMNTREGMDIELSPASQRYMDYHRKHVFDKYFRK